MKKLLNIFNSNIQINKISNVNTVFYTGFKGNTLKSSLIELQ